MKNAIINSSMKILENNFPDYDETKLAELRYGLEGFYMLITKLVVIFGAAFVLGIFKEAIILLLLFNVLRLTGFGLHASKSWMCWISSSLVFLVCPYLCIHLSIPLYILVTIASICWTIFLLYAPADTKNRPLVNEKKRKRYKYITLVSGAIYIALLFLIKNTFLQNALVCAMIIQSVLIHPMVYKLFRLPYNNYKSYVFSNK